MAGLPDSVKGMAEFSPVEDVILPLLRNALPDVEIVSWIADDQAFPFVLVRRGDTFGEWAGDDRFIDRALVLVEAYCEDPDGDEDAALLAEACRVALRDAWRKQTVVAGRGHISRFNMLDAPHRTPDWATATGPVQYADLPTGTYRYEARYQLDIRKPSTLSL